MKNVPHLAPHNFFQPRMSDLEAQHHFRHANPSDLGREFPQTTFKSINGPNLSNGHEPHPNTFVSHMLLRHYKILTESQNGCREKRRDGSAKQSKSG